MNREPRVCPLCNGTLHFRLGEYACDSCAYRAPVELPDAEAMRAKEEEVDNRRRKLIAPPPTPESQKRVFSPQDIDTTARVKFKKEGTSEAPAENNIQKIIVLCLLLLMSAIGVLMSLPHQEAYAFSLGQGAIFGAFFSVAIAMLLWGWALFSQNIIVKYVFIVLAGLNILSLVASAILLIYASYSNVVMMPELLLPYMGVVFYILLVAGLWIQGWIFFLLYSDISAMS